MKALRDMVRQENDSTASSNTSLAGRMRSHFAARRGFVIAALLSLAWFIGVIAYAVGFFGWFETGTEPPRPVSALEITLFIVAALTPVALFFYGAMLTNRAADIRAETAQLSSAIDALRTALSPRTVPGAEDLTEALTSAARRTLAEEKGAIADALLKLDSVLGETQAILDRVEGRESAARRDAKRTAPAPATSADQPILPFGGETDVAAQADQGVQWSRVVQALQFPRDEHDKEGFAALRETVRDRELAALLQGAEDTLSFLAEEGLYMEDLKVLPASLADWRRYADGARGAEAESIGGVRDDVALAIVRARLRSDTFFRDTALHFLRRFDKFIARMARELGDDPMIVEAGDTRTGRAFMLVARASGVFD